MATPDSHFSLIPTAKRSACERCRKQKVACPPRNDMESDCARCARVGAVCITGYIKPLGKPIVHRQSTACSDSMSTNTTSSPSQGSQPSHSRETRDPAELEERIEPWPLPGMLEDGDFSTWSLEHWVGLSNHSEGLQTWMSDNSSASCLEMFQTWNGTSLVEQNMLNGGDQQPVPAPSGQTQILSSNGQSTSSSQDVGKGLKAAEYNFRLSQLRVNLARQMLHRMSSSEEPQSSMVDEAAESRPEPFPSHSLGEALSSTSEFLDLIRLYKRLGSATWSHSDPGGLLDLIGCYLHLVSLFNHLFQQLHHALRSGGSPAQGDTMQGLQPLPNLHLSGFAVSEGRLQMRILLQATQHQFREVEKDLGIPPEFAVSLLPGGPNNGIHGDYIQALFKVTFREEQNNQGNTVLASSTSKLRVTIASIGRLLDELEN